MFRPRVPVRRTAFFSGLHVLLRWLVVDGYGFHEGYFHWRKWMGRSRRPRWLSSYACRVFDQGFGRSLWFVKGGDVASITAAIRTFSEERHADFWSGVGLACTYAGPRGEHADASGGHPKLRRPFAQVVVDVELGEQLPVNEGPKRAKRRRDQQNACDEPGGEKKDGAEIARGAAKRRDHAETLTGANGQKSRLLEGDEGDVRRGHDHESDEPEWAEDKEQDVLVGDYDVAGERNESAQRERQYRSEERERGELVNDMRSEQAWPHCSKIPACLDEKGSSLFHERTGHALF